MDRKTRKLFTMHRSMHPQSDVDRLYCKRTEGGRGLQSIEQVVEIEKASMGLYLHQAEEFMLKEIVQEGFFSDSTDLQIQLTKSGNWSTNTNYILRKRNYILFSSGGRMVLEIKKILGYG